MKITGNRNSGYRLKCDEPRCAFESSGWPTRKAAETRLREHTEEHASGEAMPEIGESEARRY